jgi:hypothetical protein
MSLLLACGYAEQHLIVEGMSVESAVVPEKREPVNARPRNANTGR